MDEHQELQHWIENHYPDYTAAMRRVEKTRTLLLSGTAQTAAEILKKAYVFAVLSIKTNLERHERGFTQWASGTDIREAAKLTVYPNQKADWMEDTFKSTDWVALAQAVQSHYQRDRLPTLLDALVENCKGASYRKGGFTLAMSGGYEFICIDSHVADFAGIEESEGNSIDFYSAEKYIETCEAIVENLPNKMSLPPFLMQWSIYDMERQEHARHMAFYREVLPEVLFDGKT